MSPTTVALNGNTLALLPERAVWWAREATLLVADVHIGKGTSFRQRGMAVPTGSSKVTLDRLRTLIEQHRARRLVVLGDFLHAVFDQRISALIRNWRAALSGTEIVLVLGNHDRALAHRPLPGLRMTEAFELAGIALRHEENGSERVAVSGHLHPCVRLGVDRSDELRLPVFWLRDQRLVLPAFGAFTGGQLVQPEPGDRVYAVTGAQVTEVTDLALRRRSRR